MKILGDKEKQYSTLLKAKKDENARYRTLIRIWEFILFLLIIVVIVLAYFQISGIGYNEIKSLVINGKLPENELIASKRNSFRLFDKKRNILLLGVDVNSEGGDPFVGTRTDTIIVLNIDPASKTINALSIPRDSKVYIAQDNGVQKINAAHAIGGAKLTKKTIENTLGIHIDNYVAISLEGVKKLVDEIGGVTIYVDKDLHYNDYAGKLHVNLQKGQNVLDGQKAEEYLRFRHDALGDISRTTRQQWFLKALLEKIKKPETVTKIPGLLKIASTYVKTDLSLYEMSHLVAMLRNIDESQIEFATLPGAPSKRGYASYWILDPGKTRDVLDRMIYRVDRKNKILPRSVIILYTPAYAQTAENLKKVLTESEVNVSTFSKMNLPHSQIIGHNKYVSVEFLKWLKKKEDALKDTQFIYDTQSFYGDSEDCTIILSNS